MRKQKHIKDNNLEEWGFGFNKSKIKSTLKWGFIGGCAISFLMLPYKVIITGKHPEIFEIYLRLFRYNIVFSSFIIMVLVPFIEELVFRGWIYRFLRNKHSKLFGYIGSTALFVLAHGIKSDIVLCAISSIILAFVYEKTKSLGASIIAHSCWNVSWYAAMSYSKFIANSISS